MYGQVRDSAIGINSFLRLDTLQYFQTKNQKWAKSRKTKTYENQGDYHSGYLALNPDSTFEFLWICEGPDHLTVGKWLASNDSTIQLIWDPSKSETLCSNIKKSKKYYEYSYFRPVDIKSWTFKKKNNILFPETVLKQISP